MPKYYPPTAPAAQPTGGSAGRAARVAGSYTAIRHSYTTMTRVAALMNTVEVRALPDGGLQTFGFSPAPPRPPSRSAERSPRGAGAGGAGSHACTTRSLRSRWKRRRPEDFGDESETPISRPASVTADTVRPHASQIPCRTAAALTALGARAASDFTC